MKHVKIIMLSLFSLLLFYGCNSEDDSNDAVVKENVVATASKEVKTYQLISLSRIKEVSLSQAYKADFGGEEIKITKNSDSTLVFSVPNVENGKHVLTFDLGSITFNVERTFVEDESGLIANVFASFDVELENVTTASSEEKEQARVFKDNVLSLFNSLSAEEKHQTTMYYESNKAVFHQFKENLYYNLNGSTTLKARQTECSIYPSRAFYDCTSENLSESLGEMNEALKTQKDMLVAAGVSAILILNPATSLVGLAVSGVSLAMAGYLFMLEVKPAWLKLKGDIGPFLEARFILLPEGLFLLIRDQFISDVSMDSNIDAELRSIDSDDENLSEEVGGFISSLNALRGYWDNVKKVFGDMPDYTEGVEAIDLETDEIIISGISNANVELISQSGEYIKFKSLSGTNEDFSYTITVNKNGFIESKTINASVITGIDLSGTWTASYTTSSCSIGEFPVGRTASFVFNDNNTITFLGQDADFNDDITANSYSVVDGKLEIQIRSAESFSYNCDSVDYNTTENGAISYYGDFNNGNFSGTYTYVFIETPNNTCIEDNINCSGNIVISKN